MNPNPSEVDIKEYHVELTWKSAVRVDIQYISIGFHSKINNMCVDISVELTWM